jgi:hypothetical protein
MESDILLPWSKELTTGSYPEPHECGHAFPFNFLILILSSQYCLGLQSCLLVPTKTVYAFLFSRMHVTCLTYLILTELIS